MGKKYAVVGAGPAGILAIGSLLDAGVAASDLLWVDPYFQVGDLGRLWSCVPSNTKVDKFLAFLQGVKSFAYADCPLAQRMDKLDPNNTCFLSDVVAPLQWITDKLRQQVSSVAAKVLNLQQVSGQWQLCLDNGASQQVNAVFMALGGEPRHLDHINEPAAQQISLSDALQPAALEQLLTTKDRVGVWGCSHSAVLVLKNCLDLGIPTINFYRGPVQYALQQEHGIFNDNTGLKGMAADWGRAHLHGQDNPLLTRVNIMHTDYESSVALCSHRIEAVGFYPRTLPIDGFPQGSYDLHTGIFAPGLFGLGLACPLQVKDIYGCLSLDVGLYKFFNHMQNVLPLWLSYTL